MRLAEAIEEFKNQIGTSHVVSDASSLTQVQQATFSTSNRVLAIVSPQNTHEVAACLKIAASCRIPIYPISTGKNWGNGSRVPTHDGSVLLDLSRMNRIVDFNEKLAYVSVEPGVTQAQLADFLASQHSSLTPSLNGASKHASLIGNVLERGDGSGGYGERSQYVCALEAVLTTGEIIHTGFAAYAGAQCAKLRRQGVGPDLESLLLQSNLAVVTQMTLWLEPKPDFTEHIVFSVDDDDSMARVFDALRRLSLQRVFHSLSVWNDYKVFSRVGQYPFAAAKGITPLPEKMHLSLRRQYKIKRWTGNFALTAWSKTQAGALRRLAKDAIKNLVDKISVAHASADSENLQIAYWRKQTPMPSTGADLDRDKCGFIWCMPMLPFVGEDAMSAVLLIEKICLTHALEPNIALLSTEPRVLKLLLALVYDRDVPGQDANALACHNLILSKMSDRGHLPYRLGLQSMHSLPKPSDDSHEIFTRMKHLFDPAHVLSPGRYERNFSI